MKETERKKNTVTRWVTREKIKIAEKRFALI